MLSHLDDSPWHQLPTTFDHVGTSDPRFFDRFWFAASDHMGRVMQFTVGVYQNMNVVDGGFVVIDAGRQHNVRVSRRLRPVYDTACGPLRFDVVEPMQRIALTVAQNGVGVCAELMWSAVGAPHEERHHFARRTGRVVEDYSRYDQIGRLDGWIDIGGERIDVADWWACRDHSWGVRERVGIVEPETGAERAAGAGGSFFAFLFFSTDTRIGHLQRTGRGDAAHVTVTVLDCDTAELAESEQLVVVASEFVDDGRPRRVQSVVFETVEHGEPVRYDVQRSGPAVAMQGLGYGGYNDGLGLGAYRGESHLEHEVWDVSHPATVARPDGTTDRPVHRIQPVTVTRTDHHGTSTGRGSLTYIDEP